MGLLTAEDRQWRLQRRLSGSMFTPKVVASFGRAMAEAARCVVERWKAHPEGTEIGIANELACATIDILGTTLFSEGIGSDSTRLHPALLRILDTAGRFDLLDALHAPRWLPRIGRLLARPSLALLTRTAEAMIAARYSRRASAAHSMPEDLITVLLDGRDRESGRSLSSREIRDNIITFIAVGPPLRRSSRSGRDSGSRAGRYRR
jgi:cytochrome P450